MKIEFFVMKKSSSETDWEKEGGYISYKAAEESMKYKKPGLKFPIYYKIEKVWCMYE